MKRRITLRSLLVTSIALVSIVGVSLSVPVAPEQLPEPVAHTFKTVFPNGTIEKLTAEVEDGVTVYDFEFRAGGREKETDIAGDGTMLESTLVITAATIPAPAMKAIQKASRGAKLGRLEWIEMRYEIKDGQVIKLAEPRVKYAAEMAKKAKTAEVIVGADGTVIEPPVWVSATPAAPAPGAGAGK